MLTSSRTSARSAMRGPRRAAGSPAPIGSACGCGGRSPLGRQQPCRCRVGRRHRHRYAGSGSAHQPPGGQRGREVRLPRSERVQSRLPQAFHRWQQASLALGAPPTGPVTGHLGVTMGEHTTTTQGSAQPRSTRTTPNCSCCAHRWAAHDAIAQRYCNATLAAALSRKCICRPFTGPG